jgi:hypothetical protein
MKKYLLIISICLFSCSKSTSSDSMIEAEAYFSGSSLACALAEVCTCKSGNLTITETKVTFSNCVIEDSFICSSGETITLNGSLSGSGSASGSITFSGFIQKKCNITLSSNGLTICGVNTENVTLTKEQACEALGLDEEVEE